MLCAKSDYKDSCQGDSGGPLIKKGNDPDDPDDDVVVGIVSFGGQCGGPVNEEYPPAVYSEIAGSSFISDALNGIFPEPCNGSRIAVRGFGDDFSGDEIDGKLQMSPALFWPKVAIRHLMIQSRCYRSALRMAITQSHFMMKKAMVRKATRHCFFQN